MVLLRVVSLVENQQIDLPHSNEAVHEAREEHISSTYYDLVFGEMLLPYLASPKVGVHGAAEPIDLVVDVAFQYGELLEY